MLQVCWFNIVCKHWFVCESKKVLILLRCGYFFMSVLYFASTKPILLKVISKYHKLYLVGVAVPSLFKTIIHESG